jgi:hypothetical protein
LDLLEYVFLQIQSISNGGITGFSYTNSPSPFNTENPSSPLRLDHGLEGMKYIIQAYGGEIHRQEKKEVQPAELPP